MANVVYRTSAGQSWISLESHLLSKGRLFITDEITMKTASDFVQNLMYLRNELPDIRVRVYINSPGGEINAGLMIYDFLKGLDSDYDIVCMGMAASMAAVILAGGPKGRRCILPHSKIMIHEPLLAGSIGGSASSIQRTAESILKEKRILTEILMKDTERSMEDVEKAVSFDNYMNAKEAIEFGFCDKIIYSVI